MRLPIQTARLILREMHRADWRALHAYNRDPEFHRYLPIAPPDETGTRGFVGLCLARARERPRRHYDPVVQERTSGVVLGTLRMSLREPGAGDLGYAIRRDRWNEGFATEAVHALIAAARSSLGLEEIWATVDPDNLASCRVLAKLGFDRRRDEVGKPIKEGRPPSLVFFRRLGAAELFLERAV